MEPASSSVVARSEGLDAQDAASVAASSALDAMVWPHGGLLQPWSHGHGPYAAVHGDMLFALSGGDAYAAWGPGPPGFWCRPFLVPPVASSGDWYHVEDEDGGDSFPLDTPCLQPWIATVARILREGGPPSQSIWPFSYQDFCREFSKSVRRLGVDHSVVPYMARHSGPSIDRMSGFRDLLEIQKRGRWVQFKSVQRYEKAARLAEVTNSLSAGSAAYMRAAEVHLEALLLHRRKPMGPPPRP